MTTLSPAPILREVTTLERPRARITSVDSLRGLNMFAMIFVNNLAGMSIVPWWMKHFDPKRSGMTFVDMVYPAFLFIAGISIPFALGSRLVKGEPVWKTFIHVLVRVASLLLIGVMMVNELPDTAKLGWSKFGWVVLMYLSAIAAFCSIGSSKRNVGDVRRRWLPRTVAVVRFIGFAMLVYLAFVFRGPHDERIITLSPLFLNTSWWGILGGIGWAYLMASVVFLAFRGKPTAVLACVGLMIALYFADEAGMFSGFWIARHLSIGKALGTHSMLTTAGLLLGIMLASPQMNSVAVRVRFTLLFIAGFSIAAILLQGQFGINKNAATPSWALWGCAITAAVWLILYLLGDVGQITWISRPLAAAGQNVLLAYLISVMLIAALKLGGLYDWYVRLAPTLPTAITRATVTGVLILLLTSSLNRLGFRLKL